MDKISIMKKELENNNQKNKNELEIKENMIQNLFNQQKVIEKESETKIKEKQENNKSKSK